jgi:hypothetical protein
MKRVGGAGGGMGCNGSGKGEVSMGCDVSRKGEVSMVIDMFARVGYG